MRTIPVISGLSDLFYDSEHLFEFCEDRIKLMKHSINIISRYNELCINERKSIVLRQTGHHRYLFRTFI